MIHPRLLPFNGEVARKGLEGQVEASHFRTGTIKTVVEPLTDLCREPAGAVDCQLVYGSTFCELDADHEKGWVFGQCEEDGYVGWIRYTSLGDHIEATHRISSFGGHVYTAAHMKSRFLLFLPLAAQVRVEEWRDNFALLPNGGYVPAQQITALDVFEEDHTAEAERYLGVPYLWGGDSNWGLDCSGLVRRAVSATGTECLRDSDMQASSLGRVLGPEEKLKRGDFIFWPGHVGIMQSESQIIHANAFAMAVTSEPLQTVVARIKDAGEGDVTCRRRLK